MSSTLQSTPNLADFKAVLTFAILERTLRGHIGGRSVEIYAVSGGGAASTAGNTDDQVANNPYFTGQKDSGDPDATGYVIGGPLPIGRYRISSPFYKTSTFRCCRLTPLSGTAMGCRDGMLLHGRGQRGSTGCVVPLFQVNPPLSTEEYHQRFHQLMNRLLASKGGLLTVVESFEGVRFA